MRFAAALPWIVALWCSVSVEVYAIPETIMDPAYIIYGLESSARFGTSLACSKPNGSVNNNSSYVAVGAPLADDGVFAEAGKVYLYNPSNPPSLIQTISSPNPGTEKHFGRALAFVKDINADGIDELVVGEPNEGGATGEIHVYQSALTSPPYALLNSYSPPAGIQGFGTTLLGIRDEGLAGAFVVVGAPQMERVRTLTISLASGGPFFPSGLFTATGAVGDRTGHSIAEAWNGQGLGSEASDVLLGVPNTSTDQGKLQCVEQMNSPGDLFSGGPGGRLGSSVAATHSVGPVLVSQPAHFRAFSVPGENSITVLNSTSSLHCSAPMTLTDVPLSSGTTLAHLKGSFMSLVANAGAGDPAPQDTTFASYRTEEDTGGSIGILGTNGDPFTCTGVVQLNNCVLGAQEQGYAITGGGTSGGSACSVRIGATDIAMLLVGSPAWSNNKGLVTVYYDDGSQHASPQACGTSPTPSPTPTIQPTNTPSSGGGGEPPTVEIQPGATLPAPIVTILSGGTVEVDLPKYNFAKKFIQRLAKLLKLKSLEKAEKLAAQNTSYVIVIKKLSQANAIGSIMFVTNRKDRIKKIKTRRNRVTLSQLPPGAYQITYRVVTTVKRIKRTFQTRESPPAVFTKPSGK